MSQLPFDASEIYINWRKGEHGIGVTAKTDEAAVPYIGLYPLDWEGCAAGLPIYFRRIHLIVDVVVGLMWSRPVTISINALVTPEGLSLSVCLPTPIAAPGSYPRHLRARWGDPKPRFGLLPANSNWSIIPVPREEES